ncbi:MAG: hypothetical protein Q7S57_05175 [bacterium]|nr:hypothetical protein [bacterium]
MIVDMFLRLLGENPAGYPTFSDKIAMILAALLGYSEIYLRYVLAVIPWLWLFLDKKRGHTITRRKIIIVILLSILLFFVGASLPWLIFSGLWGMMVTGIYGGQI